MYPTSRDYNVFLFSIFFKLIGLSMAKSNEQLLACEDWKAQPILTIAFQFPSHIYATTCKSSAKSKKRVIIQDQTGYDLYSYFFLSNLLILLAIREISLSQCRCHVCLSRKIDYGISSSSCKKNWNKKDQLLCMYMF